MQDFRLRFDENMGSFSHHFGDIRGGNNDGVIQCNIFENIEDLAQKVIPESHVYPHDIIRQRMNRAYPIEVVRRGDVRCTQGDLKASNSPIQKTWYATLTSLTLIFFKPGM